jgi:hypothetical protein
VIDFYRKRLSAGEDCLFQIGECRLDPLSQLLSESADADLAVLRLSEAQAREVTRDGPIGSQFFQPASWPPAPVAEGDYVAFDGFPGQWRNVLDFDSLGFESFTSVLPR